MTFFKANLKHFGRKTFFILLSIVVGIVFIPFYFWRVDADNGVVTVTVTNTVTGGMPSNVPPIPGFPLHSIVAGLIVASCLLLLIRRK